MSFTQFLSILRARWIVLLSVFLLTVVTTAALSFLLPKKYTASAEVLVDVKSPDPIAGMVLQGMMTPGYMATQLDVLNSERVALRVIKTLRLDENAQLRQQWKDETDGDGTFESWIVDLIHKTLDVAPGKESNVITISYTAVQPQFAAALANAFMQAYIDTTLELRVEPAKRYSAMFDAQARAFRDRLEEARTRLSKYQQEKGIIATDERIDVETNRLNELATQLVALQAATADSRSRQAAAGSSDRLQEVLNNPVIANLKADLSQKEARLQELSDRMGDAHPQVTELRANIRELRSRIDSETRRIAASLGVSNTINVSRQAQLQAALDQQRQRLLELKRQRDQVAIYQGEVDNAQRAYDAIHARLSQATLESQSNQTNLSVLKSATPPASASSPKILLNMALAIVLGGMLSVGCAMVLELTDRRVRSDADIKIGLDAPMLGVLQVAGARKGRKLNSIKRLSSDTKGRALLESPRATA